MMDSTMRFSGIYRIEKLTMQVKGNPKPKLNGVKPVHHWQGLSRIQRLKYAMGEYDTPKLLTARQVENLEDFIANRPRHKVGKAELFWVGKQLHIVNDDQNGLDFKAFKKTADELAKPFHKKYRELQARMYQAGSDTHELALELMRTMTAGNIAKHPLMRETAAKAIPADLTITRGNKEGFIVNYGITPQK